MRVSKGGPPPAHSHGVSFQHIRPVAQVVTGTDACVLQQDVSLPAYYVQHVPVNMLSSRTQSDITTEYGMNFMVWMNFMVIIVLTRNLPSTITLRRRRETHTRTYFEASDSHTVSSRCDTSSQGSKCKPYFRRLRENALPSPNLGTVPFQTNTVSRSHDRYPSRCLAAV